MQSSCWELGTNKSNICLTINLWKIFWYTAGNFRDKEKKREKNRIYYSAFYLEIIKFKGSEVTLTVLQDVLHTRKWNLSVIAVLSENELVAGKTLYFH